MTDEHKNTQYSEPDVRIGKKGITDGVINEIQSMLERKGTACVKFLRAFIDEHDKKEAMEEIRTKTRSLLMQKRGNVFVLQYKNRGRLIKKNRS